MTPIRSKSRLLELAAANAPTAACAKVIRENGAVVFRIGNGSEGSGWIVDVRGKFRDWLIAIRCDEVNRRWRVEFLQSLPNDVCEIKGERL